MRHVLSCTIVQCVTVSCPLGLVKPSSTHHTSPDAFSAFRFGQTFYVSSQKPSISLSLAVITALLLTLNNPSKNSLQLLRALFFFIQRSSISNLHTHLHQLLHASVFSFSALPSQTFTNTCFYMLHFFHPALNEKNKACRS